MAINMDLQAFANEVHENAVNHGWWDGERTIDEIVSLIHTEWSEAMEEYRAGRPMVWHKCHYNGSMCETQDVHDNAGGCIGCSPSMRKPEGAAVEIVDGCIRILDYLAHKGVPVDNDDVEHTMSLYSQKDRGIPWIVAHLHRFTSMFFGLEQDSFLLHAFGFAMKYLVVCGIEPFALMAEKHEYNKTRSYKHGGKVC